MRHITTLIFALSLAAATASSSLASGRPAPHFESGGTFSGSFVINSITDPLNGSADTNAFNMLMGHSLRFVIVFDAVTSEVFAEDADGNLRWDLMTAPPQVYFFGDETDYLRGIVGPALNGPLHIAIHEDASGTTFLDSFDFSGVKTLQYFGFECFGQAVEVAPNIAGQPRTEAVILDGRSVALQRYITPFAMTDFATGSVEYLLTNDQAVATEPTTFSTIKTLYRGQE